MHLNGCTERQEPADVQRYGDITRPEAEIKFPDDGDLEQRLTTHQSRLSASNTPLLRRMLTFII